MGCESMYKDFLKNAHSEIAKKWLCSLETARWQKWRKRIAELDVKHSSRKTFSENWA